MVFDGPELFGTTKAIYNMSREKFSPQIPFSFHLQKQVFLAIREVTFLKIYLTANNKNPVLSQN